MFKRKFVYRNQETGEGGGGSAGNVGSEDSQQTQQIDIKEYQALKSEFDTLKNSLDKLEANNRALMEEKVKAKQAAEKAALDAAKKSGDVDMIEKSWSEKYLTLESSLANTKSYYEGMINNLTVGATASRLASEIAITGSSEVLEPHIRARLSVEIKDDKPVIRVLDKDGKPSAMSVSELVAEIKTTPAFAPVVIGSKASGAGYQGGGWSGGDGTRIVTRSEFDRMSPAQQSEVGQLLRTGKAKIVDGKAA
jgi:hypothetical protein